MLLKDTKSGLVASKKIKAKKYSFKGQYDTKYIVKVRGIKGKKKGKWSAKKSVKTNKASTAAQKAAEEKAAAAEKAAAEAKAAQAAAEKAAAEAKAEAEKAAAEAQAAAEKAAKEAEQAQIAADIVKAIEEGDLSDNDKILELNKAYDELSDEAKALIPPEMVKELKDKADFVDRQRANAFLVDAVRLSPAKILDECDSWDKGDVEKYAKRVNNAIDTFRNELTPNQQMLVGFEIKNRLDACLFALEKADSIVDLNESYNYMYLAETYFDAEVDKIDEILNGKTNDQEEIVETGAIDKIKAAENSEEIETIVKETDEAIGEIATKPEVVTAAIEKLSTDYAKITKDNIEKAGKDVSAIEEQIDELTWKQKKDVENFDKLVSVVNKITAFGLDKDAAKAELEREAVNYYDGAWTEVKGMITDGKAAIDAATTPEEISAALAEALDKIDAVKTKVEVVRAEIEECVETYLDNLSDENIEDARKAVKDATDKYDNDLNDDQRTEVYAAEDGLEDDVDELLDQIENYDLNNAKDAAKAELENYAVEDAYFARAWGQVSDEIEDGIAAIELAETEKAVEEALANAEKAIDAIPTKPVVVTKRISRLYKDYNEKGLSIDNYSEMKERAESIREMFEGLTEEEQAAVENIDELETVEAAIGREAGTLAAGIENKIEAINDVKDIVKGRKIVFDAVEAYYSVDEDVQALVSNHDVLKNALDRLEAEWPDSITVRILALYDTADKYDALTPEEQEKYDAELIAVRAELDEYDEARENSGVNNRVVKKYRQMLKSIDEDIAEIEEMIGDLAYVQDLTLESDEEVLEEAAEAVSDAREAYDHANAYVKAKIDEDTVDALEAAEARIANLQAAAEVEEMIYDIPEIDKLTLDNAEAVSDAREAYDAYLEEYEEDVLVREDAVDALETAEAKIEALNIEAMIDELNDPEYVTAEDADAIHEARAAYKYADEAARDFVDKDTYIAKLKQCEAKLIEVMIDALPEPTKVTAEDADAIHEARAELKGATQPVKKLVSDDAKSKLNNCEAKLIEVMIDALPEPTKVKEDDREDIEAARAELDNANNKVQQLVSSQAKEKLEACEQNLPKNDE